MDQHHILVRILLGQILDYQSDKVYGDNAKQHITDYFLGRYFPNLLLKIFLYLGMKQLA